MEQEIENLTKCPKCELRYQGEKCPTCNINKANKSKTKGKHLNSN